MIKQSPKGPADRRMSERGGPLPRAATESWRIIMDRRALPLPILRPIVIGSDPKSGIQLAHGSVRPSHARLEKHGRGVQIRLLDPEGSLKVAGREVSSALLQGGEEVFIGGLKLRIERGQIAPAVTTTLMTTVSMEQEFYTHFRRELRRLPWVLISLGVHLLMFLWADQLLWKEAREIQSRYLLAAVDDRANAMPVERPELTPQTPPETPEMPDELPEPPLNEVREPEDTAYLEDLPINMVHVKRLAGLGTGSDDPPPAGFGGRGVHLEGVTGPLKERLQSYRSQGLDLVFLVDTTASMESFLRAAKRTCDRIITDLSALIPNTRLGVVAYRDQGDLYVTKATPISADRYAILNFLEGLEARGGGDVPEAILDAVEYALDELPWRKNTHRVLLIVADAPPHPEDLAKLRMRLRSATRSSVRSTVVSTIFTGRGQLQPSRQAEAEKALREIARLGGGEFAHLEDSDQVVTQLINITLGSRFRKGLEELLENRSSSPRQAVVRRKVEQRDIDWLIRKLHFTPVEPAVVEGLIGIGSPAVAMRCLDLISTGRDQREVQEAALYIIRRIIRYGGSLDLTRSLETQPEAWEEIKSALKRAYRQNGEARRGQ